jgi:hypothetical protein
MMKAAIATLRRVSAARSSITARSMIASMMNDRSVATPAPEMAT